MTTIEEGIRIAKRILLTNMLTGDNNLFLTPLLCGPHGIGKSQVGKTIAKSLGGTCLIVEGGTLKEGEITGIPYQYKNDLNQVEFKFLPHYIVKRIQEAEKKLNKKLKKDTTIDTILAGDENIYANNDLSFEEKKQMLKEGKVKPVILFFDEINRTDQCVFRELMNIILTKTINGYILPWWVFIIAAMNPCSQNTIYNTNEIDPAELDRFIKIDVREDPSCWIKYALENNFDASLVNFIASNNQFLATTNSNQLDEDSGAPSPRGWEMINLVLKGKDKLDDFFSYDEQLLKDNDIKSIINFKVGLTSSAMYYSSLNSKSNVVLAKDIFDKDEFSKDIQQIIKEQSTARNSITSKNILDYLKDNLDDIVKQDNQLSTINNRLKIYIDLLDNSSKLLFSEWLITAKTKNNYNIFDSISEIFDDKMLELLEFSKRNSLKIKEGI